MARLCPLVAFSLLLSSVEVCGGATAESKFYGSEIPKFLSIKPGLIFYESDSLFLNGSLLRRGRDYTFDRERGGFDLSNVGRNTGDTLVVRYRNAPQWLARSFGEPVPEIRPRVTQTVPVPIQQSLAPATPPTTSSINISGAKTFRFSTRSSGNSDFGQSLDLTVDGKLTSDLEISGSISDRGFNPSYGTANSRLEELDKINLSLKSEAIMLQVGDIQLGGRLHQASGTDKNINGASFSAHTANLDLNSVVARPRGRFQAVQFNGIDGVQGPYQISEGARVSAIVPNSETVWLDGRKLTRGADNDYNMDYPAGRITFTVKNIIDRRSRMELDYEPITSDYKTELYSSGGGYHFDDSAFYLAVEWYREGDIRDQPQAGDHSAADRKLLSVIGDNIDSAFRPGVISDTSGSYILVADSLPDTVYQFVGEDNGDLTVTFSFVGTGSGDYRFVGGQQYVFVGRNNGDYLPVIKLAVPQRTDFYTSKIGIRNSITGDVQAEISFSQFDRNLLSETDDGDNQGALLNLSANKQFDWNGRQNGLFYRSRLRESTYDARSRVNAADFERSYLLPTIFPAANERLHEARVMLTPFDFLKISPSYGRLDYEQNFSSNRMGLATDLTVKNDFVAHVYLASIDGRLNENNSLTGDASILRSSVTLRLVKDFKLKTEFEHDRRQDLYSGLPEGLRYNRYSTTIARPSERLVFEHYAEDSLSSGWSPLLTRNRLSGASSRRWGRLNYNILLGYQWLSRPQSSEENFLARTDFRFNDTRRRLNISASYTLSDETRNERGITYLEVESGEGNFRNEGGRFVPDPDGNFIQVEELLSDRSKVRRGEKSFQIAKSWKVGLVRLNSTIEEELLEQGQRRIWWLLPFLSDDGQPYLVYDRRYNGDIRFFPISGGHAINVNLSERTEIRNIAGSPRFRRDYKGSLELKQSLNNYFLEEKLKMFDSNRDSYFIGAGAIDGYEISAFVRRLIATHEYGIGASFRRAMSSIDEVSEIINLRAESKLRIVQKGELRASIDLYHQTLMGVTGLTSFQLTDNKPGTKGAIWSAGFNYGIKQGMRVNFRLSGRHSDESTARIIGRGEVVAEF